MRTVKRPEERKNEILDAADELFGEKGFDGTSTNDILEKVGIARGTLYHHFKSKESIMDALIERYTDNILSRAREASENESVPVIERFVLVVRTLNISEEKLGKELIENMKKPQNALMHAKLQKIIATDLPPILTKVMDDGIKQGLFDTPFPYECMEMIVIYMSSILDRNMVELTDEKMNQRIQAFAFNLERMLGAAGGSLMEAMKMFEGAKGGNNE